MKDASGVIRAWVYTTLNAAVSYSSVTVPVFSFAPRNQALPYILIGEHNMMGEAESTKDKWITEHEILIEIYCCGSSTGAASQGNDQSYVPANTITDSVVQLLRTRSAISLTGYNTIRRLVDSMVSDTILMDNNIIIYKSISLRLLLEEN